jgi:hypothetical protein
LAPQMRVAFSRMASKTGFGSLGDELMTRSTSEVASSRANDSCSSRLSRATWVSGWVAEELRVRTALGALPRFGVAALSALRLVDLRSLLERRRIAFTEAQTARLWLTVMRLQQGFAAGGMGVQGSVCTAAILSRSRPLWANNGHPEDKRRLPLYPSKQTSAAHVGMSVKCQKQT